MTHQEAAERLEAYDRGELSEAESRALRAHLADCPDCRAELEWLRRLRTETAALPRGVAPGRDLWAGIAGRLEPRPAADTAPENDLTEDPDAKSGTPVIPLFPRGAGWSRRALAAAAVLLVVASSALTAWLVRAPAPPPGGAETAAAPVPDLGAARPRTALAAFAPAEAEYRRAADDLAAVLETRRDRLAPETVETLERNLRIIDQAIRESRAALEADPNSAALARMLSTAYEAKVQTLRRGVSL